MFFSHRAFFLHVAARESYIGTGRVCLLGVHGSGETCTPRKVQACLFAGCTEVTARNKCTEVTARHRLRSVQACLVAGCACFPCATCWNWETCTRKDILELGNMHKKGTCACFPCATCWNWEACACWVCVCFPRGVRGRGLCRGTSDGMLGCFARVSVKTFINLCACSLCTHLHLSFLLVVLPPT